MVRKKIPPELHALFDQAVKTAQGSPPRKHHLVPASYLRRWAEDGKIRVTVVDENKSYLSAPGTAARETDYYRIDHPDIDPAELPPLLFETMLSKLEENASIVIDELLNHYEPKRVAQTNLIEFAWHMAYSITRGKEFRDEFKEQFADLYRMRYEKITDDGIKARLQKFGISPTMEKVEQHREFLDALTSGHIVATPHEAQSIAQAAMVAGPLGEHLLTRKWVVYKSPPILVTCDEPVVVIGGPGSPRSERSGVGVAGAVIFPLSPCALLALFHPGISRTHPATLDHIETAELNREIIAASARWAFERPSRHITERMSVPLAPPKASLREGPLPQAEGAKGELYRTYKPTRWTEQDAPPWPVARWWSSGWTARQSPRLASLPPNAKITISPESE